MRKIEIEYDDLPIWFKEKTLNLDIYEKNLFLRNFNLEPNLHIVFKDKKHMNSFEERLFKTSNTSGFLLDKKIIKNIKSYSDGNWWVQDFSSFFPLYNLPKKNEGKKFFDACAAPGGKSFQILSKKIDIELNEVSSKKIEILKSNLKRLKFNARIYNKNFIKFRKLKKYDFIILDSPCSSIGTIRKNPEIFYKTKPPNLRNLIKIQEQMLEKASEMINDDGIILYMVCSFLKIETEDQIQRFLEKKSNFKLWNFKSIEHDMEYNKLIRNNFMITLPNTVFKYRIDGFFAAYLKKIK